MHSTAEDLTDPTLWYFQCINPAEEPRVMHYLARYWERRIARRVRGY